MDTTAIQQALTPLVGLALRCAGRATNMLWVHFGEMHEVAAYRGGTKTVGDWAIHVQCAWRLCRRGRIEIAYRDYCYSPDGNASMTGIPPARVASTTLPKFSTQSSKQLGRAFSQLPLMMLAAFRYR
jgi:hypothetical protein